MVATPRLALLPPAKALCPFEGQPHPLISASDCLIVSCSLYLGRLLIYAD